MASIRKIIPPREHSNRICPKCGKKMKPWLETFEDGILAWTCCADVWVKDGTRTVTMATRLEKRIFKGI